jgi:hypothetical protein
MVGTWQERTRFAVQNDAADHFALLESRPAPPVLASDMIELGWNSPCTHFEQEGTETTEKELSSVPSVSSCSCF